MKLPLYILTKMEWYQNQNETDTDKYGSIGSAYSRGLYDMLRYYHEKVKMPHDDNYKAAKWLFRNYDKFIEAYMQPLDSHVVDEQRYYIKLADGMFGYANYDFENDIFFIESRSPEYLRSVQTQFTMSEVEQLKGKFFRGVHKADYELEEVDEFEVHLRYVPHNTIKENV